MLQRYKYISNDTDSSDPLELERLRANPYKFGKKTERADKQQALQILEKDRLVRWAIIPTIRTIINKVVNPSKPYIRTALLGKKHLP